MHNLIIFIRIIFILSCNHTNPIIKAKASIELKKDASISIHKTIKKETKSTPLFEINCGCSFNEFGHIYNSSVGYHLYIWGKGWNSDCIACTWTWGELIYNISPPHEASDTAVKDFYIHLLDLGNYILPTNQTIYGSDNIKKYAIAIPHVNWGKSIFKTAWNPFKTGKYTKPLSWPI